MPKKRTPPAPVADELWFVKELAGETPPSFEAMKSLYGLSFDLCGLRPWEVIDESELIVVRDSRSGELCYCSVMGAAGEVYSVHVYIGDEGLRIFRKIAAEELSEPGEFFASMRSVSVEFVPKAELERPDRELLTALAHPQGRGIPSPVFRAMRPGFHPWFVTADEAGLLAECVQAVITVCAAVTREKSADFWNRADTYPMVKRVGEAEPKYQIDMVRAILPPEPRVVPASLPRETLQPLLDQDYPVRGTMELDYIFSGAPVGEKNERKSFACIALAVDAETGIVYAPEMTGANVAPGDAIAKVFLKAIQANRTLPKEVRVRSQKLKDSVAPIMESFGVKLRVASQLPAMDEARDGLLEFLSGGM